MALQVGGNGTHLSRIMLTAAMCALVATPFASLVSCTGDEGEVQEPVAPAEESTGYPEDPDLAGGPSDESTDPIDEKTEAAEQNGDLPGTLTEDPFTNPPTGDSDAPVEPLDDGNTAPKIDDEPAIPEEGKDETYGDSFEDKPAYDPSVDTPVTAPDVPAATKSKSGKSGKATASSGGGTRYVNAMLLNVRESANLRAPIVRRLLGGAKVSAKIQGSWAQINESQWVRSKYLSKKPTKKFTANDVARAWKKSKYKDTWQPPK